MPSHELHDYEAAKYLLQRMPIWYATERLQLELDDVRTEILDCRTRVTGLKKEILARPRLNTTKVPRMIKAIELPNHIDDIDVVRVFRDIDGTYQAQANTEVQNGSQKPTEEAPFQETYEILKELDEGLYRLAEKIQLGSKVYAMYQGKKPWVECELKAVSIKPSLESSRPLLTFRLLCLSNKRKMSANQFQLARQQNIGDKLRIGKRVIAGLTKDNMLPGIIGREPRDFNKNRLMVFLDDGSCHYFAADQIFPILAQTELPWFDSRYLRDENPSNEACLKHYFDRHPQRRYIKSDLNTIISVMRQGSLVKARITDIDCEIITLSYPDGFQETMYCGSARLAKQTEVIAHLLKDLKNVTHMQITLLKYLAAYKKVSDDALHDYLHCKSSTARKSTTKRSDRPSSDIEDQLIGDELRDVSDAILWDQGAFDAMRDHRCNPGCLVIPGKTTEASVRDLREEFRDYGDLQVPLLLGWQRKLYRIQISDKPGKIEIAYTAPCGKIFRQLYSISRYIANTNSILDIDYFSIEREIMVDRLIRPLKPKIYIANIAVDSDRKPLENKNISLINSYDNERLPVDFIYCNKSTPHYHLESKGFTFNEEFKSGCECDDDCNQRSTCPCHRLNEEFAGSHINRGQIVSRYQYKSKRLPQQICTGLFECNSLCSCSSKCGNRVVQNGIRFRLQVRRTPEKGWGVYTLDDIPHGSYVCTYEAELLDDADQYGDSDMYYADLDYISVNEATKEQRDVEDYLNSSDSENSDHRSDAPASSSSSTPSESATSGSSDKRSRQDENGARGLVDEDDRYMPQTGRPERGARYPKRNLQQSRQPESDKRRTKQVPFKNIHDILDSHDYTLDARVKGNVGRFFNHSCDPNMFVQNVFIETHDLRFPNVAFFALRHIKAAAELTWNYNYKMDSIPGRRIACRCEAPNCKGRIL